MLDDPQPLARPATAHASTSAGSQAAAGAKADAVGIQTPTCGRSTAGVAATAATAAVAAATAAATAATAAATAATAATALNRVVTGEHGCWCKLEAVSAASSLRIVYRRLRHRRHKMVRW